MPDGTQIRFRPLEFRDLALMRTWLHRPHVARWWPGWPSEEQVAARYTPLITGEDRATRAYVVEYGAGPIGYIQCYFDVAGAPAFREHLADAEHAAGIDLFIGERELLHRGLGPRIIADFLREILFARESITACIIDPAQNNKAAIRAYRKAGFRYLTTVTVPGELEPLYLMRIGRHQFEAQSLVERGNP